MCVVDPMHNLLLGTVDWAAIVNMLRPGAARKFSDYANQVFIPYYYHSYSMSTEWMSCGMNLPDSLRLRVDVDIQY